MKHSLNKGTTKESILSNFSKQQGGGIIDIESLPYVGTPLPTDSDTIVEKVYINTSMSIEDTNKILKSLTYTNVEGLGYYLAFASEQLSITIMYYSPMYLYIIMGMIGGNEAPIYFSKEIEESGETIPAGWDPFGILNYLGNPYILDTPSTNLGEFAGLKVGNDNEILSDIISIKPFNDKPSEVEIDPKSLYRLPDGTLYQVSPVTNKLEPIISISSDKKEVIELFYEDTGSVTITQEEVSYILTNKPLIKMSKIGTDQSIFLNYVAAGSLIVYYTLSNPQWVSNKLITRMSMLTINSSTLQGVFYDEYDTPVSPELQEKLTSGTNIKTINGQSILGSGDIPSSGVGSPGSGSFSEKFNDTSNNKATGRYSHAEGNVTEAYGVASHAEGQLTFAHGNGSHAEGGFFRSNNIDYDTEYIFTTVDGGNGFSCDTLIPIGTVIYFKNSDDNFAGIDKIILVDGTESPYIHYLSRSSDTAEGNIYKGYVVKSGAIGDYSHVEGSITLAFGDGAHAEGYLTKAIGGYSHAEGCGTIAHSNYSHIQGKFNIEDTDNRYAHIVGNGINNGSSGVTRSNAHTLDWDGNAWFKGNVRVGGTSWDDATELGSGGGSSANMFEDVSILPDSPDSQKIYRVSELDLKIFSGGFLLSFKNDVMSPQGVIVNIISVNTLPTSPNILLDKTTGTATIYVLNNSIYGYSGSWLSDNELASAIGGGGEYGGVITDDTNVSTLTENYFYLYYGIPQYFNINPYNSFEFTQKAYKQLYATITGTYTTSGALSNVAIEGNKLPVQQTVDTVIDTTFTADITINAKKYINLPVTISLNISGNLAQVKYYNIIVDDYNIDTQFLISYDPINANVYIKGVSDTSSTNITIKIYGKD